MQGFLYSPVIVRLTEYATHETHGERVSILVQRKFLATGALQRLAVPCALSNVRCSALQDPNAPLGCAMPIPQHQNMMISMQRPELRNPQHCALSQWRAVHYGTVSTRLARCQRCAWQFMVTRNYTGRAVFTIQSRYWSRRRQQTPS